MNKREWVFLLFIIFSAVFLRLYNLDSLPGELYGDIAVIYELVSNVLSGHWPYTFVLSNGPLYGYIISPLIFAFGQQGYLSYKLASVFVSLFGILATYFFAKELTNKHIALLSAFIMGTCSWYLVFSRLGNAQVLIPVLVAGSLYLFLLGIKKKQFSLYISGLAVSCLGLYEMPQTFILPLLYFIISVFYLNRKQLFVLLVSGLFFSLPFFFILFAQQGLFFSNHGYVGSKVADRTLLELVYKFTDNAIRSLLSFHFIGDAGFRGNPPFKPHLDFLSGIFLLFGIWYWVKKEKVKQGILFLLVPFFLLMLPANLVVNEQFATPSVSRTIGILPIIAVVIATGLWGFYTSVKTRTVLWKAFFGFILFGIFLLNWQRYFSAYAEHLPDQNTPIGKIIAKEIDRQSPGTESYVAGCCWGQWGQPEPKGILYVLKTKAQPVFLTEDANICPLAGKKNKVIIFFSPESSYQLHQAESCFKNQKVQKTTGKIGKIIFYSISN